MKVYWDKYHLLGTNDSNIVNNTVIDLHFYKTIPAYDGDSYAIDSADVQPIVFNNLDPSGFYNRDCSILISGLDVADYSAFLEATYAGWSRKTITKQAATL
jgi:hypothetical protein